MSDKPFSALSARDVEQSIQLQTVDLHQKGSRSRLLELPAELRLALYRLVFDTSGAKSKYHIGPPNTNITASNTWRHSLQSLSLTLERTGRTVKPVYHHGNNTLQQNPVFVEDDTTSYAILATCKLFYAEGLEAYYASREVVYHLPDMRFGSATSNLLAVQHPEFLANIRHMNLEMGLLSEYRGSGGINCDTGYLRLVLCYFDCSNLVSLTFTGDHMKADRATHLESKQERLQFIKTNTTAKGLSFRWCAIELARWHREICPHVKLTWRFVLSQGPCLSTWIWQFNPGATDSIDEESRSGPWSL